MLKFAVPSYFVLHGAVARFVVDGFGKFNANSLLLSKFIFIRDKKGRLTLLNFVLASYNVLYGAVAEFIVDDFGQNCLYVGNSKQNRLQIHVY